MPFIHPLNRQRIDREGPKSCVDVGDICYVFYKHLIFAWNLEPRWRTAHRLYKDLIHDSVNSSFYAYVYTSVSPKLFEKQDVDTALRLAWDVFFNLHVMKYELEKIESNGDIL